MARTQMHYCRSNFLSSVLPQLLLKWTTILSSFIIPSDRHRARSNHHLVFIHRFLSSVSISQINFWITRSLSPSHSLARMSPEQKKKLFTCCISPALTKLHSNTAQVLTSIVEELPKNSPESSALLEEVLQLFEQCLAYQEKEKLDFDNQALAAQAMMANDSNMISAEGSDDEQGGVSLSPETSATSMDVDDKELPPPQDNRYARIIEPITNDHILDTILAQLEALTQLCSMLGSANEETMTWIEGYAKGLTEIK